MFYLSPPNAALRQQLQDGSEHRVQLFPNDPSATVTVGSDVVKEAIALSDDLGLNERTCCGLIVEANSPHTTPYVLKDAPIRAKAVYLFLTACQTLSRCFGILAHEATDDADTPLSTVARELFERDIANPLQIAMACVQHCDTKQDARIISSCSSVRPSSTVSSFCCLSVD